MHCRAVLFDLDGTLLATLEDLADSMNAVLRRHGWPEHTVDAYRYFVGEGVDQLVSRAAPEQARHPALIHGLVEEMRGVYSGRWAMRTRPYPRIPELLDELGRRGLKLGVLSNKMEDVTRQMVSHFLERWPFDAVVGAGSRYPKKPDPAAALGIAAELGVAPQDFVYLGDTSIDMRTAVSAGMLPIGVLWGFRDAAELEEAGARHLLSSPLELLPILDGLAQRARW